MASDQELVNRIQQSVRGWYPNEKCPMHRSLKNCSYDKQGKLSTLHLCTLGLTQIPLETWQFTSLYILSLDDNRLNSLPAEVGQLSSLRFLSLNSNRLSSLPAEVGQLFSLEALYLDGNQLRSLPGEIGQLSSLQGIYLDGNQLRSLLGEIGQLSSLQHLFLESNQLRSLPVEVSQLSSKLLLSLDNNPWQSPPPDIIKQGVEAIFAYLRTQAASITEQFTPTSPKPRPITIFFCYAHKDKDLRDRIDNHLGVLKRLGQVTGWYDREIRAGTEWEREIEEHLSTASIILLLVSADFVNSDYCYGVEMQKALEMHEQGKACVLPILLRPVDWQNAPFAKLQLLPRGAKPITKWPDPEEALEDVAKQIRAVVNTLRSQEG